jgi:hypothetical protein
VSGELGVELDKGRVHGVEALWSGLKTGYRRIHFL